MNNVHLRDIINKHLQGADKNVKDALICELDEYLYSRLNNERQDIIEELKKKGAEGVDAESFPAIFFCVGVIQGRIGRYDIARGLLKKEERE